MAQKTYFASCPREMEELLREELQGLGISPSCLQVGKGGVLFKAQEEEALKVLTHSRLASRLFWQLKTFTCENQDEIYQEALDYPWNQEFNSNQSFRVQTLLDGQAKEHFPPPFHLALRVKDALCDCWKSSAGGRPQVDKKEPDYPFLLRLDFKGPGKLFQGSLSLDITGVSLSHRGYRPTGHRAPLRENLAAALILASGWEPRQDLFCDPFCGSGTLLVEALLMKAQIPPSFIQIDRFFSQKPSYLFLRQKWFQRETRLSQYWQSLAQEITLKAQQGRKSLPSNQFFGNDRDPKSISLTAQALKYARITDSRVVHLECGDARSYRPPGPAPGVLLTNPPYGERIAPQTLEKIYYEFGENLKNHWSGWRAFLLTGNLELRKKIQLRTQSRLPFYNGNLPCRLLKYELY